MITAFLLGNINTAIQIEQAGVYVVFPLDKYNLINTALSISKPHIKKTVIIYVVTYRH